MSRLGMVHHRIENASEAEWETLGRWAGDEDLMLVAVPKETCASCNYFHFIFDGGYGCFHPHSLPKDMPRSPSGCDMWQPREGDGE